jgi:hypothetical protein
MSKALEKRCDLSQKGGYPAWRAAARAAATDVLEQGR